MATAAKERDRAIKSENDAETALAESEVARNEADLERAAAKQVSKFLVELFRSPDPELDGASITVAEMLDRAVERLDAELSDQPVQKARLQKALAETYESLGLAASALPLRRAVYACYQVEHGEESERTQSVKFDLAITLVIVGKKDESRVLLEELMVFYAEKYGPTNRKSFYLANSLANIMGKDERYEYRRQLFERVQANIDANDPLYWLIADNVSISLAENGEMDEAIRLREESLEFRRQHYGPDHPETLFTDARTALLVSTNGPIRKGVTPRKDKS